MLRNLAGNYLNPSSWTKTTGPVFATTVSTNGAVYGPGHCGLTKSLDGTEDWIIYHAAKYSGAGWIRNIRMQSFGWTTNGLPVFGSPVPAGVPLPVPSGDSFTPARFDSIIPEADGTVHLSAEAPLPLSTNQWRLEWSDDLNRWTIATNVPGLQFSVTFSDSPTLSNRFYRVQSLR